MEYFSEINAALEAETKLRDILKENVKQLETVIKLAQSRLEKIHISYENKEEICKSVNLLFPVLEEKIATLAKLVPKEEYYRYNDIWTKSLQNACFICVFYTFLLNREKVFSFSAVEIFLGVKIIGHKMPDQKDIQFFIPIEDFLHSLISLSSELSRLAITSVINENYDLVLIISSFVDELHSGFQKFNLKNDSLRRRFDGIKYDVKKIEEVIYNLSLRGLIKKPKTNHE